MKCSRCEGTGRVKEVFGPIKWSNNCPVCQGKKFVLPYSDVNEIFDYFGAWETKECVIVSGIDEEEIDFIESKGYKFKAYVRSFGGHSIEFYKPKKRFTR